VSDHTLAAVLERGLRLRLPDSTKALVYLSPLPDRGGQHHNGPRDVHVHVELSTDVYGCRAGTLVLVSGMRSIHKTRNALLTCHCWHEVPLAIEARGLASL
jgi:hypothetical protein